MDKTMWYVVFFYVRYGVEHGVPRRRRRRSRTRTILAAAGVAIARAPHRRAGQTGKTVTDKLYGSAAAFIIIHGGVAVGSTTIIGTQGFIIIIMSIIITTASGEFPSSVCVCVCRYTLSDDAHGTSIAPS